MNTSTARTYSFGPLTCQWLIVLAACLLLPGCGATENLRAAKQAVVQFHAQMDAEQYHAIYAAADDQFHRVTTEADLTRLLQAVHRKLGDVKQSNYQNMNLNWNLGAGATVTLIYNTTFVSGTGSEQFVWRMVNHRAVLYGYRINSTDLVVN